MSNSISRYSPAAITRPSLLGRSIFDSFFNDFFGDEVFSTHLSKTVSGYPVADIFRQPDGSTVMEFALAGFSKKEITIDVKPEKRSITVSANGATGDGEEQASRRIARRSFTKTYVNYDDNLDLSNATAEFENGLLTVTVPQRPESEPVTIKIK